jgi:hypothetical protein
MARAPDETYSKEKTQRRFEAALLRYSRRLRHG